MSSRPEAFLPRSTSGTPRSLLVAPATTALVVSNLALFLAMAGVQRSLWSLSGDDLIAWGSNYGPLTLGPQPWRLLTALFVHGGLLHVALNMLALVQGGAVVERLFGRARYLAIYFGSGLAASIASVGWRPDINSVGASGAIFGIFAALLVAVRQRRDVIPREIFRRVRSGLLGFLAFSLFAGLVIPGVDNAAHIGGLVAGLALGVALGPRISGARGPGWVGRAAALGGLVGLLLAIWGLTHTHAPPAVIALPRQSALVASERIDATQLEALIDGVLAEDQQLILGYNRMVEAVRRRQFSVEAAARHIEDHLLPHWDRLALSLAQYEPHAPPGDERLALLARYAGLRRDALRAMQVAVRTHQGLWLAASNQAQTEADRVMAEFQVHQMQAHRFDRGAGSD